jgi:hypothetical protein
VRRGSAHRPALACAFAGLLVLCACGEDDRVNRSTQGSATASAAANGDHASSTDVSSESTDVHEKATQLVRTNLRLETGVPDLEVTCDSTLEAKKGSTGACTATGDFTAYIRSIGARPLGTITELKYKIEFFVDDTTFNPTLDTEDLLTKVEPYS